jgi:hypothetical protein
MEAVGFQDTTNYHSIAKSCDPAISSTRERRPDILFSSCRLPPMRLVFSLLPPFAASRNR